jgi:hypothetical protein
LTDSNEAHVVIEFERRATPIAGLLRHGQAPPRRFSGWVELLSALETTIATLHLPTEPAGKSAPQQQIELEEEI